MIRKSNILFFLLIILMIIFSFDGGIHAQAPNSARIRALGGGAVSGIIPDTLTDFSINPSYVALTERLSLTLQLYDYGEQQYYFPIIENATVYSFSGYQTKRLTASGLKWGNWSFMFSTAWSIRSHDENDNYNHEYMDPIHPSTSNDQYTHKTRIEFFSSNVSLAKYISNSTIFGLSLKTDNTYQRIGFFAHNLDVRYYIKNNETTFDYIRKHYGSTEETWRRFKPSIQISILNLEDKRPKNEYSIKVSRNDASQISNLYEAEAKTDYNNNGILYDHIYNDENTNEKNRGNIWSAEFETRHFLDSGFIVYFNSSYSFSRYNSWWLSSYDDYDWKSDRDSMNGSHFKCRGNFDKIALLFKAGKRYRLGNKLHVTAGVRSGFLGEWASERPLIHAYNKIIESDSISYAYSLKSLHRITSKDINASIGFPLAFEFTPTRYFSFYAGYYFAISYDHCFDKEIPTPLFSSTDIYLSRPQGHFLHNSNVSSNGATIPYEITGDENDRFTDEKYLTLGFGFDVKERFLVDLYTGYDLSLSRLQFTTADLRFAF